MTGGSGRTGLPSLGTTSRSSGDNSPGSDVDDSVVTEAGRLAEQHALTALDALHLASALSLREPGEDVAFVTFDRRLREAALAEGLTVLPEVA